mmetsp:Transcript_15993/g.33805  ORF Transcript_15993/g.33805 Transcript_15993/m.33805 type:complete len:757 (+) Transcript_15993:336-2606(+)
MSMLSLDDGNGSGEDLGHSTGEHNTNNSDSKRKKNGTKSFDLATFHQLRLERLENQRRAEKERRERNVQKNRLRWSSTSSLPSTNSSIKLTQSRSFRVPSDSIAIEADSVGNFLARQELLRLGQRYASSSLSVQQRSLTLTEHISRGNISENVESQQALLPFTTNDSIASNDSEIGGDSIVLEESVIHSPHPLHINSRSSSVPIEALSHADNKIHVVSPASDGISKKDVEVYGSHYLLLARANSSPTPASKIDHNGGDGNIIDADDGSSSASYNTPTPHLQAASACNSHGENEDGCGGVQESAEDETDHFSSFCKAQVLISEIEDKELEVASICLVEVDTNDRLLQARRENFQRKVWQVVRCSLVTTFAGAVLFFCGRYIVSWYKFTYPRVFPLFSDEAISWSHLTPTNNWPLETMKTAFHLKTAHVLEQVSSLRGHLTSRLMFWANVIWRAAVTTYTDWMKDVDMLSWIIENIYRIEKVYYDALQLFNMTKYKLLEVQDSSVLAWNATLSMAISCWRELDIAPRRHTLHKSKEHIATRKSTLTTPINFCSTGGCFHQTLENETLASVGNEDDVDSIHESSSPQFWRESVRGAPFVRHQLPSIQRDLRRCLHSIPLLGSQPEGRVSLAMQWHISTSPALNERRHPTEGSKMLFPSRGSSGSRLLLNSHRLGSISICSDIRKMIEESMAAKSKPQQQTSQAVKTKRNYYTSPYQMQETFHEEDIFNDVDVMGMTRDFVGQLLQRRPPNKWRRKKGRK